MLPSRSADNKWHPSGTILSHFYSLKTPSFAVRIFTLAQSMAWYAWSLISFNLNSSTHREMIRLSNLVDLGGEELEWQLSTEQKTLRMGSCKCQRSDYIHSPGSTVCSLLYTVAISRWFAVSQSLIHRHLVFSVCTGRKWLMPAVDIFEVSVNTASNKVHQYSCRKYTKSV